MSPQIDLSRPPACFIRIILPPTHPPHRAIDRVHRLGQRRDVQVFRFTVKDTVEQQMLVIQVRIGWLIDRATGVVDGSGWVAESD